MPVHKVSKQIGTEWQRSQKDGHTSPSPSSHELGGCTHKHLPKVMALLSSGSLYCVS